MVSFYSETNTLQSLGTVPVCIPTSCFQIGLETGPIPSSSVGMRTSSPRYPILSTGLMTAAVPIEHNCHLEVDGLHGAYQPQKVLQEIQTGRLPSLPSL